MLGKPASFFKKMLSIICRFVEFYYLQFCMIFMGTCINLSGQIYSYIASNFNVIYVYFSLYFINEKIKDYQ